MGFNKKFRSLSIIVALVSAGGQVWAQDAVSASAFSSGVATSDPISDSVAATMRLVSTSQVTLSNPMPPCASCIAAMQNANPTGAVCTTRNSYLEGMIESYRANDPFTHDIVMSSATVRPIIKNQCIIEAMNTQFTPTATNFGYCPDDRNTPLRKVTAKASATRPCLTGPYEELTTSAFQAVASCLKGYVTPNGDANLSDVNMRTLFSMFTIESGFHLNAISPTGAGGVGQFTAAAIQDVNDNELPHIMSYLSNYAAQPDTHPICQILYNALASRTPPMRASAGLSCDRMALSNGAPAFNFLYSFALVSENRDRIMQTVINSPTYAKAFSKLNTYDRERLGFMLGVWAHNAGVRGITYPMTILLRKYARTPLTDVDSFIQQLSVYMRNYPDSSNDDRRNCTSGCRFQEAASYLPKAVNALNKIESREGDICSAQ